MICGWRFDTCQMCSTQVRYGVADASGPRVHISLGLFKMLAVTELIARV
jgi:hypothetical protein